MLFAATQTFELFELFELFVLRCSLQPKCLSCLKCLRFLKSFGIPGNNSPSYNPSLLTDTTYYRVNYVSNSGCGQLLSNTSQVVVLPIVVAGNIENDQFLCYDSLATPIYMDTVCYGGDNNFSYQWEFSTDGSNWNEVLGADTTVYNPGFMSLSTFYRLKVASTYDANCLDRYSNIIDVHVYDPLASGEINSSQDNFAF